MNLHSPEKQYLDIMRDIIYHGFEVCNQRTNTKCHTLINQRIQFHSDAMPLVTTRKSYWKQALLEMICYMRAYTTKAQFNALGVHTWDANIEAWDPEGERAGFIYGASSEAVGVTFESVIEQIIQDSTNRGIIWNFWNPEYFEFGCLRPCMYSHQFTVLGDSLHLTSTQRSADVPLGLNFNMLQAWFLLRVVSQFTGYEPGTVTMNITNCHIYDNQLELAKEQIKRNILPSPTLKGLENLTLDQLLYNPDPLKGLELMGYHYHEPIKYPFTV